MNMMFHERKREPELCTNLRSNWKNDVYTWRRCEKNNIVENRSTLTEEGKEKRWPEDLSHMKQTGGLEPRVDG
jgi:hypothetical protein